MKKKFFPLILLFFLLNACGSSSQGETQTFAQEEKKFVHNLFLTEYLWYDQVASNVDYVAFSAREDMINALKVSPPDKWSFTWTSEEYNNFTNQKTSGFGFGFTPEFKIFIVRLDSPSFSKLFRGDTLLEINGEPISRNKLLNAKNNIGTPTTFTVLRKGVKIHVVVTPQTYSYRVSAGKIITQNNKKIGYLRYDGFTQNSTAEFEQVFTRFKAENISELIIDMRYNGGGSIDTASALLDNITNAYPNQRQVYLDWNPNYQNRNSTYSFEGQDLADGNELTMTRVFFLVTKNSASASELVISALKPYLGDENVITIGTSTHGKPVGFTGHIYNNHYYFIVNFLVKNNQNQSTSFSGIPATCTAIDDLNHQRDDENETMLSTALYYIENNVCP
jgi:hypothetical protein